MGNRKSQQGTLKCSCAEVLGIWENLLPPSTPLTARAHTSAPRYVKQLRTMTRRGPDLFLYLVLTPRQFIVFYRVVSHLCLVRPAIAENGYIFLFLHSLMATGPFYSCTYVKVASRNAGSRISSCVHSLPTRQLSVTFSLIVVTSLVPALSWGGQWKADAATCFSLRAGATSDPVLVWGGECKKDLAV